MTERAPAVIVVGEALVDITNGHREQVGGGLALTAHAGGSPANVAVGLARLGVSTQFAARISSDEFGSFLRAHLQQSGADLSLCVNALEPTTLAVVGLDDAGAANYSFYVEGTADWQWQRAELPPNHAHAAIHTGSLAIGMEPGAHVIADWIAEQHARGDVLVSLDPNVRPALLADLTTYRHRISSLVAHAHLIKVSDEDLLALEPAMEPLATAMAWATQGPELVVVTHGADGATAIRAGAAAVHSGGFAVDVVDTIGAGDAFAAGLIAFLAEHAVLRVGSLRSLDAPILAESLRFAGHVAALTCARAGADPPWRGELDAARRPR